MRLAPGGGFTHLALVGPVVLIIGSFEQFISFAVRYELNLRHCHVLLAGGAGACRRAAAGGGTSRPEAHDGRDEDENRARLVVGVAKANKPVGIGWIQ